jgi:NAD+ diphosphatase
VAFPRLAPAVITLIERDDGRILLARNPSFPAPFFSLLAGFVEPGETLEEAVVRETFEEVGLLVGDVTYWGSQPWPFPHSLMVGFTARYVSGELVLQEGEIAEAGWFSPDELPTVPPTMSIAGRMIEAWARSST